MKEPYDSFKTFSEREATRYSRMSLDKIAHEFKKAFSKISLSIIKENYEKSLSCSTKPQLRRAFSKTEPELYTRVREVAEIRFPGRKTCAHNLVDNLLKWLIGYRVLKPCPKCSQLFFGSNNVRGACSQECSSVFTHTVEANAARRKTVRERYKKEYASQNPSVRRKMRETIAERTPEERTEIKTKREGTLLKKYGVSNPTYLADHSEKRDRTLIEKFGSLEVAWKSREASIIRESRKRYGTDYPIQDPEVFRKTLAGRYRLTSIETIHSGKVKAQGSSEVSLVKCLDSKGLLLEVPNSSIDYKFQGKRRKYFPDLFVRNSSSGASFLVEVKSDFTLKRDLDRNCAKFRYANRWCRRNGVKFVLCISRSGGRFNQILWPTPSKIY